MKLLRLVLAGLVVAGCSQSAVEEAEDRSSDTAVQFHYEDVVEFNELLAASDGNGDLARRLEADYVGNPTPALADYIRRYSLKTANWLEAVESTPRFYASLDGLEVRLEEREEAIVEGFSVIDELYGLPITPVVNYIIGPAMAGGIADESGVIISAEIFSLQDDGEMFDVPPNRRILHPDRIPAIVLHEYVHALQRRVQTLEVYVSIYSPDNSSLLKTSLREGSADFIAYLATGTTMNEEAHAFGEQHQAMLWEEFQKVMRGSATDEWLFRKPVANPDWPTDLGYYMGFKITQSYYEKAEDKEAAIPEILNLLDYEAFLREAAYAPGE